MESLHQESSVTVKWPEAMGHNKQKKVLLKCSSVVF